MVETGYAGEQLGTSMRRKWVRKASMKWDTTYPTGK